MKINKGLLELIEVVIFAFMFVLASEVVKSNRGFKTCVEFIEKYPAYSIHWVDKNIIEYGCYVDIDENARVKFDNIEFINE